MACHVTGAGGAAPQQGKPADTLVGRCLYTPLPRLQKAAGEAACFDSQILPNDPMRTLENTWVCSDNVSSHTSITERCPMLCIGTGLSAAELTAQNLDKSGLLEDTIAQQRGGDANELLAEFELAFASFLYGQSLEGAQIIDDISPTVLPELIKPVRASHAYLSSSSSIRVPLSISRLAIFGATGFAQWKVLTELTLGCKLVVRTRKKLTSSIFYLDRLCAVEGADGAGARVRAGGAADAHPLLCGLAGRAAGAAGGRPRRWQCAFWGHVRA